LHVVRTQSLESHASRYIVDGERALRTDQIHAFQGAKLACPVIGDDRGHDACAQFARDVHLADARLARTGDGHDRANGTAIPGHQIKVMSEQGREDREAVLGKRRARRRIADQNHNASQRANGRLVEQLSGALVAEPEPPVVVDPQVNAALKRQRRHALGRGVILSQGFFAEHVATRLDGCRRRLDVSVVGRGNRDCLEALGREHAAHIVIRGRPK
jgi:hypothetical protein